MKAGIELGCGRMCGESGRVNSIHKRLDEVLVGGYNTSSIHEDAEQALSGVPEGHWMNNEHYADGRASPRRAPLG